MTDGDASEPSVINMGLRESPLVPVGREVV